MMISSGNIFDKLETLVMEKIWLDEKIAILDEKIVSARINKKDIEKLAKRKKRLIYRRNNINLKLAKLEKYL